MIAGNILLTGASGFLGRAIMRAASLHGISIRPVFRNEDAIAGAPALSVVIQPALNSDVDWAAALADVNVVIHAAARVHVMDETSADPLAEFRKINVDGTLNLAKQAIIAGVRRFVFISSIGVNGSETTDQPFRSTDVPVPVGPYAISKFEAEKGLQLLAEQSSMELVIIRPPLVYGPGAPGNFGRLVSAVQNERWLPLGAVHNRRTLVALDNLVSLILLCTHHPAAANEVFLAGDAEDISTTDLLLRLGIIMGRPARLLPVPVKLMEFCAGVFGRRSMVNKVCGNLQLDITKTRDLLGWAPPVSVNEGLRRVVRLGV
jgi:nucleoside-diphosphate-sugar epimerase